jgi:N-acetylglucosamine-6-phosphate deacetylase
MRPFSHRDPGIIGAALIRREVRIGLIADPSHLAPDAVHLAFQAAPGRIVLVTDALAATECLYGRYWLGEVEFDVADGVARRTDGTLVGSTGTLLGAVRHARAADVPMHTAINAATVVPAALHPNAGLGLLRPGDPADVVILDDDLTIRTVIQQGILIAGA